MVSIRQESGAVLIIVLLFSTLFSMIAFLSMEMTWLEAKMTQSFVLGIQQRINSEQEMIALEQSFYADPELYIQSGQARFIQFVPDSIRFGERSGQTFYELCFDSIITTQVLRQDIKQNENEFFTFSNGVSATIDFETHHGETHLVLRDVENNAIQASFLLPRSVSGGIVLLATDRFSKGWVDAIYIGNAQGEVWQLDTMPLEYESWSWRQWGHVDVPIKAMYATHYQPGFDPLLLLATNNKINNEAVLHAILNSKEIWSFNLKNDDKFYLQSNWLRIGDLKVDVHTGMQSNLNSEIFYIGRRNWRQDDNH
jgi:hypothetical protein